MSRQKRRTTTERVESARRHREKQDERHEKRLASQRRHDAKMREALKVLPSSKSPAVVLYTLVHLPPGRFADACNEYIKQKRLSK